MAKYNQLKTDIIFVVVVLLAFGAIYYFSGSYHLAKDDKYTIATVIDVHGVLDGDPQATIIYKVNGEEYKGSITANQGDMTYKTGDRIFVEYYPKDPNKSEMVYDKLVADSISSPLNGWDSLPY